MGNIANLDVWHERWHAMKDAMQYWTKQCNSQDEVFERQSTLINLLASLQAFGESQMNFFLHGLASKPAYRLEPSAEYPWEYVFRATIDQIGYDMDVILRAYQQRIPDTTPTAMRGTLELADKLAYLALKPAIKHKLVDNDVAVVTYFQKNVNVHLIPYAPVALIGIPFSAVNNPRDLLALPHEVGHYIFRNGRVRGGKFADSRFSAALYCQDAQRPPWFTTWLEEAFADVYGCLVAGPVMALECQALNVEDSQAAFLEDDGEHPVGALRPYIYLSVLKRMVQYKNAVPALEKNWQNWLDQRGNPTSFHLQDSDKPLDLAQAATELDTVVEMLLRRHYLGMLLPKGEGDEHAVWSQDLSKDEPVEALYAHFKESIKALDKPAVPALKRCLDEPAQMYLESQALNMPHTRPLGTTCLWLDAIKDAAKKATTAHNSAEHPEPVFSIPPQVWTLLLDGGGWATEGPGMPNS